MSNAELIAEARKTAGYSEGDLRSLIRSLAAALEAQPEQTANVTGDAPEAPIHYSASEAWAWQSGWEAGFSRAQGDVTARLRNAEATIERIGDLEENWRQGSVTSVAVRKALWLNLEAWKEVAADE